MKISTRNLLAEMILTALDDRITAASVRCLAAYCRTVEKSPPSMTVTRFLQPAPEDAREAVRARLQTNPLLSWDLQGHSGHVTLSTTFSSEWGEIIDRLLRFGAALNEWSPTQEASQSRTLRKGALLFNHHLFFEVHEVLEAQWVQESGEAKLFLQGLIQVAVAFHHRENHNLRGALSLLQDGMEKILPYQPVFLGVELHDFITGLDQCGAELRRLGEEGLASFQEKLIPRLRFGT